jgi:hypothetical protein
MSAAITSSTASRFKEKKRFFPFSVFFFFFALFFFFSLVGVETARCGGGKGEAAASGHVRALHTGASGPSPALGERQGS